MLWLKRNNQQNLLIFITANIKSIKSFPEGWIETEREDKNLKRSFCSFRKKKQSSINISNLPTKLFISLPVKIRDHRIVNKFVKEVLLKNLLCYLKLNLIKFLGKANELSKYFPKRIEWNLLFGDIYKLWCKMKAHNRFQ